MMHHGSQSSKVSDTRIITRFKNKVAGFCLSPVANGHGRYTAVARPSHLDVRCISPLIV